jgi:hypothetical protein
MLTKDRIVSTERIFVIEATVAEATGDSGSHQCGHAWLQVFDSRANFLDIAGYLTARNDRKRERIPVDALSNPEIQTVE